MEFVIDIHKKEKDFIEACVNKERWAQRKLYEDFYPSLMPLCMRYTYNQCDAIDILHEAFIKIFKNIHKYQTGTSLKAWVKRIVVNTAIDGYRKNVRRRTEDIETAYSVQSLDPDVVSQISCMEILEALKELTPVYRMVFNLYVIEGYSHREVGKALNITESTSRSNLVKARTKLKKILLSKGITNER